MPSQASVQPGPQPLVGGTEGPPAADVGSASSFMHEVTLAIPSEFVALLLACTCTLADVMQLLALSWCDLAQAFDGVQNRREGVCVLY